MCCWLAIEIVSQYSIIAAIDAAIALMISGETVPIFSMNRCVSTPRNCNVSTADGFVNRFDLSGSTFTCQIL
jgi:hypothetical protein